MEGGRVLVDPQDEFHDLLRCQEFADLGHAVMEQFRLEFTQRTQFAQECEGLQDSEED